MKTVYVVYFEGKPAKFSQYETNEFDTVQEAVEYLDEYLDDTSPGAKYLEENAVGKVCDYSGFGDVVEIRKERR